MTEVGFTHSRISQEQSPWSAGSSACGSSSPRPPRAETQNRNSSNSGPPTLSTDLLVPHLLDLPEPPLPLLQLPLLPRPPLLDGLPPWARAVLLGLVESLVTHVTEVVALVLVDSLGSQLVTGEKEVTGDLRGESHLQPRTWQLMQPLWKGFLSAAKTCSTGYTDLSQAGHFGTEPHLPVMI